MQIIIKHLSLRTLHERFGVERINGFCCFTGNRITKGVAKKKLIKGTFGDRFLIKNNSEWVSVEIAMLMTEIIRGSVKNGKQNWNALRTYNCFFSENHAHIGLKNGELLDMLFNVPETPFIFLATYSNKKHIAYFAKEQHDTNAFTVYTDQGELFFDRQRAQEIREIVNRMYTPIPEKPKHTYFNKKDLRDFSQVDLRKVKQFGKENFKNCLRALNPHLNSFLYDFIIEFTPSPL